MAAYIANSVGHEMTPDEANPLKQKRQAITDIKDIDESDREALRKVFGGINASRSKRVSKDNVQDVF